MLKQTQQLKLLQKLSPQQIQLMKLIQIPTVALEERIKQEIEENPALEEGKDEEEDDFNEEYEEVFDEETEEDDFLEDAPVEVSLDEYKEYFDDDDDVPNYKLNISNTGPDEERKEMPHSSGISFQDYLMEQLGLAVSDEKKYNIGRHLIGTLDDSGYLTRELEAIVDDLAFQNIMVTYEEIEDALTVIQEFDPPGVGARNLKECLYLQLKRKFQNNPCITLANAMAIIDKSFMEFSKKHFDKIIKKHNLSEEQMKDAMDEVRKLNPKPGNTHSGQDKSLHYITPDFTIKIEDTKLVLSLNSKNAPDLKISKAYNEMLKEMANQKKNDKLKDTQVFVKDKIEKAKWFIDAIKQRQATLLLTMDAIMEFQGDFFKSGDYNLIRPMILKDIADKVELDISTISRVANSKYVETPYGIFPLKSFFSESLQTQSGEEVSTIEVKNILKECVSNENKKRPMTDDKLCSILKEKGYNIARRTVAKYREQLDIPVARMRKEL
ncbi:MAG: RNA polymerase factor sigma-54 [Bacteroidales bacterium]|nr:RNA polymerase factor sigma-54 [Bacteroidales bacterium]